ncbi:hypothetical protein Poly51_00420 [Rubripirellula tenax]|uniref:SLA1 homology domain-containing protein n=1 Tax=Rubripirellula tenax TaxID=2528015 RepID=A0A5C6FG38_9BACT|nr:hypothetical protein [Rubripirellula tenax]TWU59770.1 hypothetical protein Poly51_00420 [Rubripirellula tenax]
MLNLPFKRLRFLATGIACAGFGMATIGSSTASAESWTDLRGTRTIEARMIGMWGDNVMLELQNGNRVSVNMNALRSESRIQAQQLSRELKRTRGERVAELQGQAIEAAAPAPTPIPVPPPAPAYVLPTADTTVDAWLKQIESSVRDGHVRAIYDALPPSYRADVNEIVKTAAEKMDAETWQSTVGTLHQLGDLIVTKQRWFLSSPRIKNLPPSEFDTVNEEVMTLAGALRMGLAPDVTSLNQLRSKPFDQWLSTFDKASSSYIAQLFNDVGGLSSRTVTVDSTKDDTAIVSIDQGGKKSRVTFTKVEGYWVPKSLADNWTTSVASLKQSVADEPAATLLSAVMPFTSSLASMTGPMATASTADQYHFAMESIFTSTQTLESGLTWIGGMLGKKLSMTGSSPYGNNGYSNSYEEEMMMNDYDPEDMARQRAEMEGGR